MKFLILRKKYICGIYPVLVCSIREVKDKCITENKIKYTVRRCGYVPEEGAYISIKVNGEGLSFVIDRNAYTVLNFSDKSVMYKIDDPMPYLISP